MERPYRKRSKEASTQHHENVTENEGVIPPLLTLALDFLIDYYVEC
jgi:hypothetical protein